MFPPRWRCWNSERALNLKQPVSTYAAVPRLRASVISKLPQLTSDVIPIHRYECMRFAKSVCELDTQRNVLFAEPLAAINL